MKSYTDIEQSKKLAEILPIESTDMYYKTVLPQSPNLHKIPEIGNPIEDLEWYNKGYTLSGKEPLTLEEYCLPCWSLAALLDVLPRSLIYTPNPILDGYSCKNIMHDLETYGDNPIDACYELILQLHKLKML